MIRIHENLGPAVLDPAGSAGQSPTGLHLGFAAPRMRMGGEARKAFGCLLLAGQAVEGSDLAASELTDGIGTAEKDVRGAEFSGKASTWSR